MAPCVRIYSDSKLFAKDVTPWLLRDEAARCVEIGLLERLVARTYVAASVDELEKPLLMAVQDGNSIEAVAIQTLRDRMLVAGSGDDVMRCLAKELADGGWTGSSIVGPSSGMELLARSYAEFSGRAAQREVRLRTFQLDTVCWPQPAAGGMRPATPADRPLLVEFIQAFSADVAQPESEANCAAMAERLIEGRRIFLWVDEEPVAMAAWAGPTPNGVRINFVYTPADRRGRGYASNLVAALSQRMLDRGKKFCFLNTDLSNPTSNSIYQKIGYRAVGDCERWEFSS